MCLVKVRQEEDVVVPYRVVHARSSSPHRRRSARVSQTYVSERHSTRSSLPRLPPAQPTYSVPPPQPFPIPAPQPVPVFVEPPPPPPPPPRSPPTAHAVYVERHPSPSRRSSSSSSASSRSNDRVIYEREYRRQRRDYSPSSQGDHYQTYRYLDPPEEPPLDHYIPRESSRRRSSQSRDRRSYYEEPRDSRRRVTRERIEVHDSHGSRREYRR